MPNEPPRKRQRTKTEAAPAPVPSTSRAGPTSAASTGSSSGRGRPKASAASTAPSARGRGAGKTGNASEAGAAAAAARTAATPARGGRRTSPVHSSTAPAGVGGSDAGAAIKGKTDKPSPPRRPAVEVTNPSAVAGAHAQTHVSAAASGVCVNPETRPGLSVAAPVVAASSDGDLTTAASGVEPPQRAMQVGTPVGASNAVSSFHTSAPARPVPSGRQCAFLRLSTECKPSQAINQLVYLNQDELTFGRLPTCDVKLDSTRFPQMISRVHGKLTRRRPQADAGVVATNIQGGATAASASNAAAIVENGGVDETWRLYDNKSLNGIIVNGTRVPEDGVVLRTGDVIIFGRLVTPPEFEFVFEGPSVSQAEETTAAVAVMDEEMKEQLQRITELQRELDRERQQRAQEDEKKKQEMAKIEDLQNTLKSIHPELTCSVCHDWLVHAATIECTHSFCWDCIDRWLLSKNFDCPVCRTEVRREPVRIRALDAIVQKSVDGLPDAQKKEYSEREQRAEKALEKARRLQKELDKSVTEAAKKGKDFFNIGSRWGKREKDIFQRGVKDYSGATRATYCRLTGFTEQWVHSATDTQLNQALHNLQLQSWVSKEEVEIRQRLLMYLKYG